MRLVCPECHNSVTVPDDAAGKEATCPNCGKSFPTPSRYTAAVSELGAAVAGGVAAPPPGMVPPVPPPPATPGVVPPLPAPPDGFVPRSEAHAAGAPGLAGYTRSVGVTISPKVVAWLPAVLLTVLLVLTFFPWVGSYAGDSAVYSQRPWGALFGSKPARNFKLEQAGLIPSSWLDKIPSDWKLLVPFFLLLFLAFAFAWAERGLHSLDPRNVPPLAKLWPWRNWIVAGVSALALLFLLWQLANGFAMERAIKQQISEEFADRRAKAADSPATLEKLDYEEKQAFNGYNVEGTWWLSLALLCNVLAVGAVGTRLVLDRRGNKAPPKLLLHY